MTTWIKTLILLLLLLQSSILVAENRVSIEGFVTNFKTEEPMPGVNIVVEGTGLGAASREDGYYIIKGISPGKYKITASMIGYTSITREVNLKVDKKIDFAMEEEVLIYEEIKVTAKSEAREIQEQAIPVAVITVDEIQGTVSNVNELLTKTAGVKIRSSGGVGSTSRISVRGLEGKRVGFFVDDAPMSDQSDFISFNDIPLDIIERIEIYKGIVPAKFGGSAIGGAVNIVTKDLPPKYFDLSYRVQSFNTHAAKTIMKRNFKEKGLLLGLGVFYTYSDNDYTFDSPYNPDLQITRDHDTYEKKMIGGSLKAKKWWFDEVAFDLITTSTKQEIQGITQNIQEAVSYSDAYFFVNETEKEDFLLEGLDFNFTCFYSYTIFKFQDKAMQRYNWDGTTYSPVTSYGGEIGTDANDSYNQKHTVMQKTNLNYIINENSSISLNTVYNYAYGIPEDTLKDKSIGYKTNFESTMNSFVSGVNYETNFFNRKLTNSATLKHYYYSISTSLAEITTHKKVNHDYDKSNFGFSNAIRYRFSPEFLIKAAYAYDVRLPSENELLGDGFLTVPAPNLEPERNSSINIGFMYDHTNKFNNRLQLELNVFYMKLDNMIRYVGSFLQSNYENFGEMRTLGADIDIKYDLTSWLYIYANATYQDLRDTREYEAGSTVENPTKGDRMPNIPYFYYNAGFELHKNNLFGGKKQESKFYFENSFVEEYFYDFEQSIYQERRIPRSSVFNMGLEHSFRNKNVIIGLQINNITNEKMMTIFNRPMPGRTASFKARYVIR
ncbi:MAG: TonB-dependent receptor [Ignavibacteria bacterium]|jgi:outer membrane receptor protein involved in Fe transport